MVRWITFAVIAAVVTIERVGDVGVLPRSGPLKPRNAAPGDAAARQLTDPSARTRELPANREVCNETPACNETCEVDGPSAAVPTSCDARPPHGSSSSRRCARNSPSPSRPRGARASPGLAGPPVAAVAAVEPEVTAVPIRIGYARCSSATQELQSQLDALTRAHCTRVFSEKISTRIKVRPELDKALTLAHEIKTPAPDQPVILAVHELKRLSTPPNS